MARRSQSYEQGGSRRPKLEEGELDRFSYISDIKEIVKRHAHSDIDSEEEFLLYLRSWWSRTYQRPLKDPLLDEYSLEELYYEYCDRTERVKAAEDRAEEEGDRIEEERFKAAEDWAEQEEKKELEELRRRQEEAEQKKWMEEQIRKNKAELGEDFGEDVSINFTEM